MLSFEDFLRWYITKNLVLTLEALQKVFVVYHNKSFDMLKLGCTLLNLAIVCLHSSTIAIFYPIRENDNDLL